VAGFDRRTGRPLDGWAHTQQSLNVLITTDLGERVMRYRLGGRNGSLLDKPGNALTVVDHFIAIQEAIEPREVNGFQYGEPRFDLARIVPRGNESGLFTFELIGLYYPRGHLGDFSVYELKTATVIADLSAST
jgi:uncharacterized protein